MVPVGLPDDHDLKQYNPTQFAVDDYVFRLARLRPVYEIVSEFRDVSYDIAMLKLTEVHKLLGGNAIPIRHSKRLLHLLRGITGFRASPAEFAARVIDKGLEALGKERLRDLFRPLIDDLQEAATILSA